MDIVTVYNGSNYIDHYPIIVMFVIIFPYNPIIIYNPVNL
jgi:hypothetical protein